MNPSPDQSTETPAAGVRLLLTVEEAAERLGVGRTTMYALIRSGAVESIPVGRLRRIPPDALETYITNLRAATSAGAA